MENRTKVSLSLDIVVGIMTKMHHDQHIGETNMMKLPVLISKSNGHLLQFLADTLGSLMQSFVV